MIVVSLGFNLFPLSLTPKTIRDFEFKLITLTPEKGVKTKHHEKLKTSNSAFQCRQQGRLSVH